MKKSISDKLAILADAAKYDVSCSSSGSKRKNKGGLGNSDGMGICHSYTEDGRCVSLLKILLTNHCIFDCKYCVSRKSNDVKRVAFTVDEVVELTINFYRRNYIEGLFLSSGIFKNADFTTERLVRIAKKLREEHHFHGYIHLKVIPDSSPELIYQAGLYADRLSVNLEIPTETQLKLIAPEKDHVSVFKPMNYLKNSIVENRLDLKKMRSTPKFAPGGQSTQMVIGATPETDYTILQVSQNLYQKQHLKRVYYSGYVPINSELSGPLNASVIRENRLYQADWLFRFYGYSMSELVDKQHQNLDLDIDPKLGYALRHYNEFPVDINKADLQLLKRIPGIGVKTAMMIAKTRKYHRLRFEDLKKMGGALNRAQHFIDIPGNPSQRKWNDPLLLKQYLTQSKAGQLSIF